MLNRIYIIVGTLAIIILAGAFIAPRFIQWGDYRARMEDLATTVLGTPVTIRGDIEFSLLPQPRLGFSDVVVGSAEAPAATVAAVEAEFSLMEFLRDDYNITRLVLRGPVVDFAVDESGLFGSGVNLDGASSISLGEAMVEDATLRLVDARSQQTYTVNGIDGQLGLSSFAGPFSFQGTAGYEGTTYALRINSSEQDEFGSSRVSAFLRAEDGSFSVQADGVLAPGMAPKYEGTLTYRRAPAEALAADEIHGDLVFESKVTGSTDRIVLSGYTLQPDENRAGTRLTGAASIQLGARLSFDAVISGGVFSLPPRDANEDTSVQPYELVRLLSELPAPILPPIPGRIGVDLAEVGLRAFSVRNVRLDASFDGAAWSIEQFIGQLPGDTEIRLNGTLDDAGGRPDLQADFSVTSARLDGLVALWRKASEDNPLFNQGGSLDGRLMLVGDALGVHDATLTLGGQAHGVELRLGFGAEQRLDVVGHFGALGPAGSAVLGAMLPAINAGPAFGISFPHGSFALTAASARILDLDGADLMAEGQWTPDSIGFSRLAAADWGGLELDGAWRVATAAGAVAISGNGQVGIGDAAAPALAAIHDLLETPASWRGYLSQWVPMDLALDLAPPAADGNQVLTANGTLGAGTLTLRAELTRGLNFVESPLRLSASLESTDVATLTRQVGLGAAPLFAGSEMLVTFGMEGTPSNSLTSSIVASSGEETIGFGGELFAGNDGEIGGTGRLDFLMADAGGLGQIVGATGLTLPMAQGTAQLHFEGDRLARLTEISGQSGETGFSGDLSLSRTAVSAAVSGSVSVDAISVEGLAATLFGRAALVSGDGLWPEGPIAIGAQSRTTRGTVAVTAGSVQAAGQPLLGATTFELTWDDARLRVARFEAAIGDGLGTADITVCCAGPLAEKTVSGRLGLVGVPIDAVATPAVADSLDGILEGGVRFEATGASIADVLASLAGEGNFTVADLSVDQMGPGVFPTVAGLEGLLDIEPDALGAIISLSLGQGAFTAPLATGAFTIAGGIVRLSNMIVEGDGAGLAGSLNLALVPLSLDGAFTLTPRDFVDPIGLVNPDTSRIVNRIAGTLLAPVVTLDLEEMVAAIQVRANELEVERLEILRAEDAERQRAAAEERNRLIEEQRQRAAEEAARIAAEEEAARLAAEAEEAQRLEQERLLLEQQQPQPPVPPTPSIITLPQQQFDQPLDLGLNPVNQPVGPSVNELIFPID